MAIKEIIGQPSPALRRRFATEAIVTGHREHPGIPSVYERGVDAQGAPFHAMRRVQGRTLAARLAEADTREKRLALLPLVTRVAQTIGFAHDQGVVHRDIKPDNILVGDHGEVVVLDWGLARVRGVPSEGAGSSDLPASASHTVHGAVIGTPAYMAPEQASGDLDRIDERSDVFALGALLFPRARRQRAVSRQDDRRDPRRGARREAARAARGRAARARRDLPRATARDPAARQRNAHDLEEFEASAVLGRPSRALQVGVDVLTALAVLMAFVGIVAVTSVVSSFHQQGPASFVMLGFGALGSLLSVVEWRTRGRYRLGPLALAFAAMTFLGAVGGLAKVFGALAAVTDAERYRTGMAEGLFEVLGQVAVAATLTGFQLLLWAAAKRRAR